MKQSRSHARIILPAVLVAAFCAQGLRASDVTFYVGGINPGNLQNGSQQIHLDGGAVYGFRLNLPIIPTVGLEQTVAFSSNFLAPAGLPAGQDSDGFIYNANVIVNIPLKTFTPYATAGAGFIWQHGSGDLPVGGQFAVNYGGGVKWKLFGPTGLRLDVRGYTTTKVYDSSLNMFEASIGFFVKF
jgi:hypothetical protein